MADQYVKQDGSVYLFKPGDNGSLTDLKKKKPTDFDSSYNPVAKIVPDQDPGSMSEPDTSMPATKHGYSMGGQHVEVGSARG